MLPRSSLSRPPAAEQHAALAPPLPVPRSVADTGLQHGMLVELLARHMQATGKDHVATYTHKLKLPSALVLALLEFMTRERLAEVMRRGAHHADADYQLTEAGRQYASASTARCRYLGPAPVTLAAYCAQVLRQSVRQQRVTQAQIDATLSDLAIVPAVRENAGSALNAGRPIFLHGAPGSGKTTLAMRLGALLDGHVRIPYALAVDDAVIQLYDPLVHYAPADESSQAGGLEQAGGDRRWVLCRRPVVHAGAELTLDMLGLRYAPAAGYYHAPLHLKANNGLFIVDDVGSHAMPVRDLVNRWLLPLDRASDRLSLAGGYQFAVPFDMMLVFASRHQPDQLADAAFLRRMAYKIALGELSLEQYRSVVQAQCCAQDICFDAAAFDFLAVQLHRAQGVAMLPVYPRDLLALITDHARYLRQRSLLTPAALQRAWDVYFSRPATGAAATERRDQEDLV
ncbi:MAG TPA: ATP-binding protein [Burkholderiaceae bacterium]